MKKILSLALVVVLFFGLVGSVAAQEAEETGTTTRLGLLFENWQDRMSLWLQRDVEKKAELEARIAEKYERRLEQIETLPDEANAERVREVVEKRRQHYVDQLERRFERRDDLRERLQHRLDSLEERRQMRQEHREEMLDVREADVEERMEIREEQRQERQDLRENRREERIDLREDKRQERDDLREEQREDRMMNY